MSLDLNVVETDVLELRESNSSSTIDLNTNLKPPKTNYPFVDVVRFMSMVGIVWVHIDVNGSFATGNVLNKVDHPFALISYIQFWRFEVINFFIISGFLLGDQNKFLNPWSYLKRRVKNLIKPFLFAFVLFLLLDILIHRFNPTDASFSFLNKIKLLLIQSSFWFIPNYLIALSIILLFNKYIYSKKFGAILLIITIAYSILTTYTYKFQAPHTTAFLAYPFYIWLGIFLKKTEAHKKIFKINPLILMSSTIVLFIVSSGESYLLSTLHLNVFNILRLSNQLYSLSVFALLIRISGYFPKFKFFNPRKETYGIYLYHIFITILPRRVYAIFHLSFDCTNAFNYMIQATCWFVFCYLATVFLVKFLIRTKIGYL